MIVHGDIAAPADDEILVVRRALAVGDDELARFTATLDAAEHARVARYAFPYLRRNATVSRGTLRALLGSLLGIAPGSLAFTEGTNGKPALRDGALEFNVSHTDRWLYIAIARERALGVDVEGGRPLDPDELAPSVFTPDERAELVTYADRTLAFLRGWTRKEAYLKARGTGLFTPLDEFSVSLGTGEVTLVTHAEHGARYTLVDLPAPEGHAAALAWPSASPVARVVLGGW